MPLEKFFNQTVYNIEKMAFHNIGNRNGHKLEGKEFGMIGTSCPPASVVEVN